MPAQRRDTHESYSFTNVAGPCARSRGEVPRRQISVSVGPSVSDRLTSHRSISGRSTSHRSTSHRSTSHRSTSGRSVLERSVFERSTSTGRACLDTNRIPRHRWRSVDQALDDRVAWTLRLAAHHLGSTSTRFCAPTQVAPSSRCARRTRRPIRSRTLPEAASHRLIQAPWLQQIAIHWMQCSIRSA
jgi:hypothetical protein